jgi:hypothetical protein
MSWIEERKPHTGPGEAREGRGCCKQSGQLTFRESRRVIPRGLNVPVLLGQWQASAEPLKGSKAKSQHGWWSGVAMVIGGRC